jgi:hypothetical protein
LRRRHPRYRTARRHSRRRCAVVAGIEPSNDRRSKRAVAVSLSRLPHIWHSFFVRLLRPPRFD